MTLFGVDLLLTAAVPLVLVALAQMFVVGGSEIDLGVGAFAGLVNVLSATFLVSSPRSAWLTLALALAGYAALGLLIQVARNPGDRRHAGRVVHLGGDRLRAAADAGGQRAGLAAARGVHLAAVPDAGVACR